jgi:ERCC4-type nuclease
VPNRKRLGYKRLGWGLGLNRDMSLVIDRRETDLMPYLKRHDVPLAVRELEFGDAIWSGNGYDGHSVYAIERKRMGSGDFSHSMIERRLTKQLGLMRNVYDVLILVIEGVWRCGAGGEIEIPGDKGWKALQPIVTYRQVEAYLATLTWCAGVSVWRTNDPRETAALYDSLYRWSQKEWHDHHAHDQIYAPVRLHPGRYHEPTLVHSMVAQLPGLDRRAEVVARYFPTAREFGRFLATSQPTDWQALKAEAHERGLGIGPVVAQAVCKALDEVEERPAKRRLRED